MSRKSMSISQSKSCALLIDFLHNYIYSLKLSFLTHFFLNFSDISLDMPLKFIKKFVEKIEIFSNKASYARSLFYFLKLSIFMVLLGGVVSPLFGDEQASDEASTSEKPYIFLFSGPPGSGRAKLAVKVHTAFAIPHISCAEMVMDLLHEESPLGEMAREQVNKGGELSDEFFLQALFERIKKGDCKNGFVLEGIPRTVKQAETLLHKLSSSFSFLAFHIVVPDEWLIQRVHRRFICTECGRVYQEGVSVPKVAMQCNGCGSALQQRVDDQPKVIAARLKTYRTQLEPILALYTKEKILLSIKGERSLEEMFQDIIQIIQSKTGLKYTAPTER